MHTLTPALAIRFADMALRCIGREYPYQPGHVITGPDDIATPRALHPAFYGCFDWHSAVHDHWLLVRLLRHYAEKLDAGACPGTQQVTQQVATSATNTWTPGLAPETQQAATSATNTRTPGLAPETQQAATSGSIEAAIHAALGANLTEANLAAEAAYFKSPAHRGFERTYGWAWLLKLAEELHGWDDPDGQRWSAALAPLVDVIVARYLDFLPKQTYPIRVGTHPNTAFGLAFALDYARATGHDALEDLVIRRSLDYYAADCDCPANWEPGGNDFFSPCLVEADLMRRVLRPDEFPAWLARFLPGLAVGKPAGLLTPATVTDRSDGQLAHLDGLNLSRAWHMAAIAAALPTDDPRRAVLAGSAARHLDAGLIGVAGGDYMGEHWLATFALCALDALKRRTQ